MPDYIETLKIVGNAIEITHLQDIFNDYPDFGSFMKTAHERGHIMPSVSPDGRKILKLTPEGQSYLKKESLLYKKWYRKPEWWGIIISGLLGSAGLALSIYQLFFV